MAGLGIVCSLHFMLGLDHCLPVCKTVMVSAGLKEGPEKGNGLFLPPMECGNSNTVIFLTKAQATCIQSFQTGKTL